MPPLPPCPTAVPRRTAQVTQMWGLGTGASGAQCHVLSSAQHHLVQHSWHQTGGPVTRGFVPRSGDTAPRRGTAEVTGAVHAQSAALPSKDRERCSRTRTIHTHTSVPHCTLLCVQGTACSQVLPHAHTPPTRSSSRHHSPCAHRRLPPSLLHTHTPAGIPPMHPLCVPYHPSLPGQHSKVHLETSARKPVG